MKEMKDWDREKLGENGIKGLNSGKMSFARWCQFMAFRCELWDSIQLQNQKLSCQ